MIDEKNFFDKPVTNNSRTLGILRLVKEMIPVLVVY